jgi:hypothetical protein
MAMAGADPFAIMKAMGHTDIKTTMIYVSLGKSHIREQVDKLNAIRVPRNTTAHRQVKNTQTNIYAFSSASVPV